MFPSLFEDLKNPAILKDIIFLVFLKVFFGIFIYWALLLSGLEYPFNFHDFSDLYRTCSSNNINIGFTQLVCIANIESINQPLPILISISLILMSFILIYCAFFYHLNRVGQIFLIIFLIFHPYILISSFRLTTDLFAMLAVSIASYHIIRNIEFDFFFYAISILLISFRYHLTAIFFPLFLYMTLETWKNKRKFEFINIFFISLIILGLAFSFSYAIQFASHNEGYSLESIFFNAIYLLGFREMVGIDGIAAFLCCNIIWHNIQFAISLFLIFIHSVGIFGLFKLSRKTDKKILIILIYLIPCLLVIGHLRFLLPLTPLILGGASYLIFSNRKLT